MSARPPPPRGAGARRAPSLEVVLGAGLLAALCAMGPAPAKEIPPADPTSLESALARAAAEGGLVALLVIRTEESEDNDLLAVLGDPRVEQALKGCLPLLLAADRHPAVAARYGVRGFPAVILIDGTGREAGRVTALSDASAVAESIEEITREAERRSHAAPKAREAQRDPCELLAQGQRSWNAGQKMAALELLESGLAAFNVSSPCAAAAARARITLGDHSRESRRPLEAEAHYRSALELLASASPREQEAKSARAWALAGLALSLRDSGRSGEGASGLREALEAGGEAAPLDGPGRERALFLLGELLHECGEEGEARERWAQCAREFPESRYGERASRYLGDRADGSAGRPSPAPASR